jgi:hypothetical protein
MLMAAFEARRAGGGMFEMRTDKLGDLHARVAALKRKAAALGVPVRKCCSIGTTLGDLKIHPASTMWW